MKIFLTGASGFLGSHIARILVLHDNDVTAMVRSKKHPTILNGLEIKYCQGDLTSPDTDWTPLKDADVVIHAAAVSSFSESDPKIYQHVNFEGTRNILKASEQYGVKRFIYISSRGTLGTAKSPEKSDETNDYELYEKLDDYMKSKLLAEKLVLEYAEESPIDCIVLSPTALLGSFDEKPTPMGRIIKMFLKKKIKAFMNGGINVVDVEDAALAVESAITKARDGEVYILGNTNITLKELFMKICRLTNQNMPLMKIPYLIVFPGALMLKYTSAILKAPAMITPRKVYTLHHCQSYCCCSKAVNELGMQQTPITETLKKTKQWFLKE